jgi:tetratricopeptide (TPR) repeat protein
VLVSLSRLAGAWLGTVLALGWPAVGATQEIDLALARGDCAAAVRAFDAGERPGSRVGTSLAYCLVRAERFDAALDLAQGDAPPVVLVRAMALYHLERQEEARALLRLTPGLEANAEAHFYRGMLAYAERDWSAAVRHLEGARRLDPERVEPAASFHAAQAWRALGDEARAREALQRVSDDWPGTPWAREAQGALARPSASTAPVWVWLEVGAESDDNVVLRGTDLPLPQEIANERDKRAVWHLQLGRQLLDRGEWSGGVAAAYTGWLHDDLDEFDTHYPSAILWLDRRFDDGWALRGQYDFGYAWVDEESFLAAHDARLTLFRTTRLGRSQLFSRAYARDYGFPIADIEGTASDEAATRDRDGKGISFGLEHELRLLHGDLLVRARYTHDRYDAEGREYSYEGNGARLELVAVMPLELHALLSVDYQHRAYRHPSTFELVRGSDRRENDVRWAAELERALTPQLALIARYAYRRNRANVDVFDFRRHIGGIYVRWRWTGSRP